jgi:hypothetical protein
MSNQPSTSAKMLYRPVGLISSVLVSRVVKAFTFGLLGQLSGVCGPAVAVACR